MNIDKDARQHTYLCITADPENFLNPNRAEGRILKYNGLSGTGLQEKAGAAAARGAATPSSSGNMTKV